jgi:hypothetical protein
LSICLGKVFDMDFLQKYFNGVFELPLPRNTQKRTQKKVKEQKKSDGGWVGLGFSKCTGGVRRFVLPAPRHERWARGGHVERVYGHISIGSPNSQRWRAGTSHCQCWQRASDSEGRWRLVVMTAMGIVLINYNQT